MVSGLVSSRARTLDVREGSIPGPDKVIDGVPHWKRSTVLAADDLLDRDEARLELRNPVTLASWGFYINQGRVPELDVTVAGVPHWKRLTIRTWDANRPGAGAGGGRPKEVKETKPRNTAPNPMRAGSASRPCWRRGRSLPRPSRSSPTARASVSEPYGA